MTRIVGVCVGAASVALAAAGCGGEGGSAAADDGRLQVVTTVAPITSIVAAVGGDRVAIEGLVPEGTNSHTFEPPPSAAAVLARADVLFVNGLELEEPTEDLAEANLGDGARLVELGERDHQPRRVPLRLLVPRVGRQAQPPPVDQPADGAPGTPRS